MIFLSAGHHLKDPGAVANGYKENELAIRLRDLIAKELDNLGAKYILDKDTETLAQYLNRIQTGSGSVVCELHWNASSNLAANGCEILVKNNPPYQTMNVAKKVIGSICEIAGFRNRGVKTEKESARGSLGLMKEQGIVLLIEMCFITHPPDMDKYFANEYYIAQSIAIELAEADKIAA